MTQEAIFTNVPLSQLESHFKTWFNEVLQEQKPAVESSEPNTDKERSFILDKYIPKTEVRGALASNSTLWNWERQGKLKLYSAGGKRYYKRADIEALFVEVLPRKK